MSVFNALIHDRSVDFTLIAIPALNAVPSQDFYIFDSEEDISGFVKCDPMGMSCRVDRSTLIVPTSLENFEDFIAEIESTCTNHYKYGVV